MLKKIQAEEKGQKTSVWLPADAERALEFLRSLPGGFNLSRWLSDTLIILAKERGWRG